MNRIYFIALLIALVIVLLVQFFSGVFFYVVISIVIATVLRPLVNFISQYEISSLRIRVPRFLAIVFSYGILLFVLIVFVLLFVPLISDQIELLSAVDYEKVALGFLEPVQEFEQYLIENNVTNKQSGFIVNGVRDWLIQTATNLDVSNIFGEVIAFTGSLFVSIMSIIFITSFLLYEEGLLRKRLISIVPNRYFEVITNALHKIEKLLSNYLTGLLFQMFSVFTIASIGLSIMGVNYAVTVAVFAAVANVIPYLGPFIGSTFGIIIGLLPITLTGFTEASLFMIIKIACVFLFVQLTDNMVIQPLIFSKSVKVHPLEIFVIIFVGATMGGIIGMIAAIPVYTIVRVSVSELYKGTRQYRIFKIS